MAPTVATFSRIGAEVDSLESLCIEEAVQSLCLHRNSLSCLDGLQTLTNLRDVNLSCNKITSLISLSNLALLSHLNLADNKLTELRYMATMRQLQRLQVQHNQIETLFAVGLDRQPAHPLQYLNLRGNPLSSLQELANLTGFSHLKHLEVGGSPPLTPAPSLRGQDLIRLAVAAILPQVPWLC